jgi:hypothetical protein
MGVKSSLFIIWVSGTFFGVVTDRIRFGGIPATGWFFRSGMAADLFGAETPRAAWNFPGRGRGWHF